MQPSFRIPWGIFCEMGAAFMENRIVVMGGRPLNGAVRIPAAKNSVLPLLAASMLCGDVRLRAVPRLSDVAASLALLRGAGCAARWEGEDVLVSGAPQNSSLPGQTAEQMRASILFCAPLLAKLGRAETSLPGGCNIGARPIDLHLAALRELGAEITERYGELRCKAKCLRGTDITLAIPSVGATENAILAACGAEGTSVIYNAAREPEIVDLQALLRSMGARVNGAGGSIITVEGGAVLHGCTHRVIGDRIVCATYLCAAAAAGGEVRLTGVDYRAVSTVALSLAESGCEVRSEADAVSLRSTGALRSVRPVRTAPYPGFPTDAQPVLMAALLRSEGCTVFVENIFENRYRHVDELSRMGAEIRVAGRVAVVNGVRTLHGAAVKCTDLRGGAALVIAGLSAEGTTRVTELTHIDRGYDAIERDLAALGAQIRRETT